jgi:hypothetical protein
MEVLIFWLICGAIAGLIYSSKGRSAATGCVGGFLLGPIGIILAILSSRDSAGIVKQSRRDEEKAIARGELKRCPHCAEAIRYDAKVCKHCGRDIVSQSV